MYYIIGCILSVDYVVHTYIYMLFPMRVQRIYCCGFVIKVVWEQPCKHVTLNSFLWESDFNERPCIVFRFKKHVR